MRRLLELTVLVWTLSISAFAKEADSLLVHQGERLAAKNETAKSLLMLNRFIDGTSERVLSHRDSLLLLRAVSMNAHNYQVLGNLHQSLAYFRQAIAMAASLSEQHQLATLYNNVFSIYYTQHENTQAEDFLQQSLKINMRLNDSSAIRNNYNNLGLVCIERHDFTKALDYMNRALDYTPKGDKIGQSVIMTNRADVFCRQERFDKAEQELTHALALQQGIDIDNRTIQTMLNMAQLKAMLGKRHEAMQLQPAIYAALPKLPLAVQSNSLVQLADIHFILGDSTAALKDILRFQALDDSLKRANNTSQLQQLLVAYDTERLQQSNEILQTTVTNRTIAFLGTVVFLLFMVGMVVVLIRRMRIDKQKNRLIREQQERLLQYEQQEHERKQRALSSEIEHKNRQLTTYTLDLASINEFHQHIAHDLATLREAAQEPEAAQTLREVIHRLEHFNDKPLGDDFRLYFDEVHPGFLQQLSDRYHLGKTDLRLCAYLRLGMTTKEIAALTYKEVRSVESQRNRLRKKLGLEPGSDLMEFLMQQQPNN